jgi:hypothetical protein
LELVPTELQPRAQRGLFGRIGLCALLLLLYLLLRLPQLPRLRLLNHHHRLLLWLICILLFLFLLLLLLLLLLHGLRSHIGPQVRLNTGAHRAGGHTYIWQLTRGLVLLPHA